MTAGNFTGESGGVKGGASPGLGRAAVSREGPGTGHHDRNGTETVTPKGRS